MLVNSLHFILKEKHYEGTITDIFCRNDYKCSVARRRDGQFISPCPELPVPHQSHQITMIIMMTIMRRGDILIIMMINIIVFLANIGIPVGRRRGTDWVPPVLLCHHCTLSCNHHLLYHHHHCITLCC